MQELPTGVHPNGAVPSLVHGGGVLRSAVSRSATKVNRAGAHYRVEVSLPPLKPETARVVISRLIKAKREGLRIEYPLLDVDQGVPGSPVVDGAGQAGLTLNVRGLTPNYAAKEGFWLSVADASGQHYLHNVGAQVIADADGKAAIPLSEMLRVPFADGNAIHLGKPMIEGLIDGEEQSWTLELARLVGVGFTIEEAA